MPRPGTTVTISAVAAAADPGQRLGTWFVAAETERGPLVGDPAKPLRNLADFAAQYGTRNGTYGSALLTYDAVDAFWRAGGGPVVLARVVGPAAAVAAATLNDRAGTPLATLRVASKGPGAWGNTHLTVTVANGAASNTFTITILVDGVAVESSADLTSPTDAVTWFASSRLVTVTDLASATAAPNNIPAVVTAATLSGGGDDLASVTDTHWTAALNALPASWGPGLVSKVGVTSAAGHAGTVAHAAANTRQALLDGPLGASAATLATLATTVQTAASSPEFAMVFGPWLKIPAAAGGPANRLVPSSAIAAGLISRQVTTGPANEAAAGANGAAQFVLDTNQLFTDTDLDTLNGNAPVNVFKRPYSASISPTVELYGYNTLGLVANGWRQATAQILRLRLVDELKQVAEKFVFSQIDGRGQKIAEFAGAIKGVMQSHYDDDELFGATAADAYTIDTASVNTPDTLALGQLNARVGIRVSPEAEFVFIDVAKFPVNQSLTS